MVQKKAEDVSVSIGPPPSLKDILQQWFVEWIYGHGTTTSDVRTVQASVKLKSGKWLYLQVMHHVHPPPGPVILVPVLTMLLMLGAVIIIVIRRITKPLKQLATAAQALGRGERVAPVPVSGPFEARQTIEAFNDMRERLSRFVLDRTRMLAAVGHDLRTPITSLRLRTEFIEDEETRTRILATLDEMQHMVEGALAFAQQEVITEPMRMVDLNALVQSVCADQTDIGRNVCCSDYGRVLTRCRPNSLKRALRNLVENAVYYGKSASVNLKTWGSELAITVEDDGPGIAEADLPRAFEPFVRLDEARGEATGGIGLGLAIARSIIRGHGGDIQLMNRSEGGLRATILLPHTT
jgi:signal transduction histidine kinase